MGLHQKISQYVSGFFSALIVASATFVAMPAPAAAAVDPLQQACSKASGSASCSGEGTAGTNPVSTVLDKVTAILSIVLGVVSVVFIIIAGFKYITASGDANAVASAKKTIIYALVGLVAAMIARPIINFVVGSAT